MSYLLFDDTSTLADFETYVGRAKQADPDGAIRLMAVGQAVAAWVCVLEGSGLTGDGTVLGLRVLHLSSPAEFDTVTSLAACSDRLARRSPEPSFSVPPTTLTPPWAALTPPRSRWQSAGEVPAAPLREAAETGIAEVAQGATAGAGALAVAELRRRVWSVDLGTHPSIPRGAAFGLHVLGFLPTTVESVTVHQQGRWTRLSTPYGHVLTR